MHNTLPNQIYSGSARISSTQGASTATAQIAADNKV